MSTYSLNFKELSKVMGTRGNRDLDNNSISVRGTLEPVARDEANVEVEKNETVLTYLEGDPIPTFYRAGGKRHSNGGTPLNLPPDSFVFSDTSSMKLTGEVLKDFGFNSKKKYTPAELSYQYDINKYRKTLVDPLSDEIDRLTAELMISNNINKLGKLALLQESKKGFPQGIPVVAMPYVMTSGLDPSMFIPSEYTQDGLPMARKGGSYGNLPKYQDRGELQRISDAQSEQSEPYEQNWRRFSGKRIKNFFDDPYLADKTLAGMDFITGMNERDKEKDFLDRFSSGDKIYGPLAENQDRGDYMVHSPYMLRPNEYTPVQFPGNLDSGMGIAKKGGALRRVRLLPKAQIGRQSLDSRLDQPYNLQKKTQPQTQQKKTFSETSFEKDPYKSFWERAANRNVSQRTSPEDIDPRFKEAIDKLIFNKKPEGFMDYLSTVLKLPQYEINNLLTGYYEGFGDTNRRYNPDSDYNWMYNVLADPLLFQSLIQKGSLKAAPYLGKGLAGAKDIAVKTVPYIKEAAEFVAPYLATAATPFVWAGGKLLQLGKDFAPKTLKEIPKKVVDFATSPAALVAASNAATENAKKSNQTPVNQPYRVRVTPPVYLPRDSAVFDIENIYPMQQPIDTTPVVDKSDTIVTSKKYDWDTKIDRKSFY